MRVPAFELEVFFGKYEFSTPYLLAQSDCEAMSIEALLSFEPDAAHAQRQFLNTSLGYGENNGRPDLRQAVAELYCGMAEENVVLFTGAQEGIFACMNTLLEPGDHVVCTVAVRSGAKRWLQGGFVAFAADRRGLAGQLGRAGCPYEA